MGFVNENIFLPLHRFQVEYIFFRMPRGIPLNDFQKDQALEFRNQSKSLRHIYKLLKVSKTAIYNYLRNPENHPIKKKTVRP